MGPFRGRRGMKGRTRGGGREGKWGNGEGSGSWKNIALLVGG